MSTKKILIVEDEKPLAMALNLKLKGSGFDTDVAYDGDEALDTLKKGKYDLMLIDIMMPKRDGWSVLGEMKQRDEHTPVFVMSNLGQEEDIKHAKSFGVKDYIVKSNTPLSEIVERIQTFFKS